MNFAESFEFLASEGFKIALTPCLRTPANAYLGPGRLFNLKITRRDGNYGYSSVETSLEGTQRRLCQHANDLKTIKDAGPKTVLEVVSKFGKPEPSEWLDAVASEKAGYVALEGW